jgi:riboflavin synthase
MFTGLVSACVPVLSVLPEASSLRLRVANAFGELEPGESIAVNGTCLTVESWDAEGVFFFASQETLARTALGALKPGARVNLERAMLASDRLGGHVVQGHVDGVGRLVSLEREGGSWRMEVEIPRDLMRYCVPKGSICLDGTSLTINEILPPGNRLWIQIIPHTFSHTRLQSIAAGESLNVEVDVIAKYVERLCQPYSKP